MISGGKGFEFFASKKKKRKKAKTNFLD